MSLFRLTHIGVTVHTVCSNPCGIHCFGCAVYVHVEPLGNFSGAESFLPLAPFVMDL